MTPGPALLVVALGACVLIGSGCSGASATKWTGPVPEETGIPFGPNELPPGLYGRPYTGSKVRLYPKTAISQLQALRASGMRVTLKLVGPQRHYSNDDGSFSLVKWKRAIDRFRRLDLDPFVADGTIYAHQLVSEAKAPAQWGGTIIPNDVLDEMARYSKSIWPQMPTLVRTDPGELESDGAGVGESWPDWTWKHLDAASARYLGRKDDPTSFAREAQASADRQGLALVMGLNVLAGGDGSSEIRSPTMSDAWVMSAEEIRTYASSLMLASRSCGFELWRYFEGDTYFSRPEIQAAMEEMVAVASTRPAFSCAG